MQKAKNQIDEQVDSEDKPKIYLVTFSGRYFTPDPGSMTKGLITKPFEVTVKIPEAAIPAGVRYVFKERVAPQVMPKKYPDYQSLYYFTIEGCEVEGNKNEKVSDIRLMGAKQLLKYIADHKLPIRTELFKGTENLQTAIEIYQTDPEGFKVMQEHKARTHTGQVSLDEALSSVEGLLVE